MYVNDLMCQVPYNKKMNGAFVNNCVTRFRLCFRTQTRNPAYSSEDKEDFILLHIAIYFSICVIFIKEIMLNNIMNTLQNLVPLSPYVLGQQLLQE